MIRCKLIKTIHPDETQVGAQVGRAVSGESLSVGRAAACKIYLPDARVRLEHATIRHAEDGFLYLDAAGPVVVDQRSQTSVRLAMGQKISIGPYDFIVERVNDGPATDHPELTLSFSQRPQTQAAVVGRSVAVGLSQGWLSRRMLAWVFGLVLLVLGGAWPVWHAYGPAPEPGAVLAPGPALRTVAIDDLDGLRDAAVHLVNRHGRGLDTFWNPGPVSSAHQKIGDDCRACHVKPFERVTDASCTLCHKDTGDHVRDARVAHETFQGQRCASCHKEHQGAAGMRTSDTVGCVQCHGDIRAYSAMTLLGNVSDFATGHPAFRLSIRQSDGSGAVLRTPQTAQLRNDTGLVFPHDIHLAAEGIKSPRGPAATGGRVVLECASCHTPDAAGVRFEPVRMDRHCQSCHRLSVDPQAPEREVPHADPRQVQVAVREIYASLAVDRFPVSLVTVNSLLQRPAGERAPSRTTSAGRWVEQQSRATFSRMFEKTNGVCTTCHAVQRDTAAAPAGVPWRVAPIVTTAHWLPQSRFSHAQHKNAECTSCHDAPRSDSAAQILIPDITSCRDCHTGARPHADKVVSRCDSCHGFHPKKDHPVFQQAASGGVRP